MLIRVYLNRAHKDPTDATGVGVLLAGACCKLPEAEAEDWINKGWADPHDPEAYAKHLEAKIADPVAYMKAQAVAEIEAKAAAAAACAQRKEDRPNLAVLSKRKGELRAKYAAERRQAEAKAKAVAAVDKAKAVAGKAGGKGKSADKPEG